MGKGEIKMKKSLAAILACTLLFGLVACKNGSGDPIDEPDTIDFRNKTADGTALSRSAKKPNPTFSVKLETKMEVVDEEGVKQIMHTYFQNTVKVSGKAYAPGDTNSDLTSEELDTLKTEYETLVQHVHVEDCDDGIKLSFTTPAEWGKLSGWSMVYVDKKHHKSTAVVKENAIVDGNLEVIYPLVIPGREARFWIQLWHEEDGNNRAWYTELYYTVMPAHGSACVDDLHAAYKPHNYAKIVDGDILEITKSIPPTAENLIHTIMVYEKVNPSAGWKDATPDNFNTIGLVVEKATEAEINACKRASRGTLTFDLNDYLVGHSEEQFNNNESNYWGTLGDNNGYKNFEYMFATFGWTYTLSDHPGYTFLTPMIITPTVKNTKFKK